MAHADLDSPGPLSPMPKDIHCAARLVATIRDLQPPLPAKSMGVVAPIRQYLGAIWAGCLLHLGTLLAAKLWQASGWSVSTSPTILAWDWNAVRRILPLEARSP